MTFVSMSGQIIHFSAARRQSQRCRRFTSSHHQDGDITGTPALTAQSAISIFAFAPQTPTIQRDRAHALSLLPAVRDRVARRSIKQRPTTSNLERAPKKHFLQTIK